MMVVGRVDRHERRDDLPETAGSIVGARCLEGVQHIVGVGSLHVGIHVRIQHAIGVGQCRRRPLPDDRVAAGQPEQLRNGAQPTRCVV